MTEVTSHWLSKMAFECQLGEHRILIDADPKVGGENRGTRPKPLLLAALSGCTGMDVVSLLGKMRVSFSGFEVKVNGTLTEEPPKYYHKIHITYILKGKGMDRGKVEKAVSLSMEKYCGVSAMLKFAATLTYEIQMIEE